MDKNYGGVIWTTHALQRLKERNISQGDAWATWKRPDQSRYATAKGAWIYYKIYPTQKYSGASGEKIEVVAKQNEKKEWLILSVWSRPVYGSDQKGKGKVGILTTLWRLLIGK